MGMLSFVKEAGEKLFSFGHNNAGAAPAAAAPAPSASSSPSAPPTQADVAALNEKAASAIVTYIKTQNLPVENLNVSFDGATATATVSGQAPDQATREKVILCCGNIQHVEHVNDQLTVAASAQEGQFYTVVSGDNLSKISRHFYGDPNKYNTIFEANQPMLTSPDKIYPGQMLRIPPQA